MNPKSGLEMKATKENSFCIKADEDMAYTCDVTGIAITNDGRILVVDIMNGSVKMFSKDFEFLSSENTVPFPWDISILNEEEAVVGGEKTLAILDITNDELAVKSRHATSGSIHGIVKYKDRLVVTCPSQDPVSVKLTDLDGGVYWSISCSLQEEGLFYRPWYVKAYVDNSSSAIIVADTGNGTITKLNADTGEIMGRFQVDGKCPRGITTDTSGNIFACYTPVRQVAVLSPKLTEEKILLSEDDGLHDLLRTIAYDAKSNRLYVSYSDCDYIDCFKLQQMC